MPTINGVTFTELDGSCSLRASQDGMQGTRTLDCAWDDRKDAVSALLGEVVYVGTARNVLAPPDTFPGYDNLEAYDLQMEGVGLNGEDTDGGPDYDLARFTVQYKVPEYGQDAEDGGDGTAGQFYETEQVDYESSFLSMPGGSFLFDDGTPVLDLTVLPIEITTRTFTKKNLLAIPSISGYINCVNNAVFNGVPIGNLLFSGAKSSKKVDANGKIRYDVTYTFKERSVGTNGDGWNYIYNPARKAFEIVNPLPFKLADLTELAVL